MDETQGGFWRGRRPITLQDGISLAAPAAIWWLPLTPPWCLEKGVGWVR